MHHLQKFVSYLVGPATIGLALAIVIVHYFPDLAGNPSLFNTSSAEQDEQPPQTSSVSYADAVNVAAPAVVNIYTLKEEANKNVRRYNPYLRRYNNESRLTTGTGSGVIISEEGYIITNHHVVDLAEHIRVALQDGREATPQIVGFSKEDDMAVLKIDLGGLTPISIGDPDSARIGDVVLAIGNPFGVGQTVTQGIISGTRRKGLNIAHFENFIQTDAAINPGNSGGALVDAYGRLLGINIANLNQTKLGDADGISFAIPVDRAIQTMSDILEYGKVVRGWLGVVPWDLTPEIVRALNLKSDDGVFIRNVYLNGPADIAGLASGDILLGINSAPTPNISSAIQEFANLRPGDLIQLNVLRGNENIELQAVLTADPQS